MRVTGDLGFSSLVLVICFVFPVFLGFVIRRKWRLAVARNEEIKRLLVLASEEAARAELEAFTNYGSAPLPVPQGGNCAVCYCPTTTRCARCKAVRYCSGKCQIIHWRQGHKEECHPPEAGSDFGGSGARSGQNIYERETMEGKVRPYAKDGEAFRNEQISAQSSCSEVLSLKDENMSVEFHEASSTESSDVFSGFSSATHSESSDDTSVCESIISDDCVRPDEALSEDNTHSVSGTTCSKIADQVEPLSPKFASLVDSVVNSRSSTALDKNKSCCVEDGDQCRSGSPSGLSCSGLHEDSMCRPSGHPSCFWSTLDEQRNIAHDNCSSSSCKGVGECGKSDSESALQFSFNLSEKTLPPLHQQDFNNADKKPESRSALRENESADCSSAAHSPLRKLELLNCIGDEGSNNKPALKLSGSDRVSSSSVQAGISLSRTACSSEMDGCKLRNSSSGGPPVEDTCTTGTSHESRSREAVYVSSSGADVLKAGVHLSSFGRIGKDENGQTHSMISSRVVVHLPSTRNGSKKSVWRVLDQFKGSMLPKPNRSGVGYDAALKCNDKGAFPYQLFLKLYTWKGVELHPRGLVNCGNSCYANVVLQCLAFTPPLTAYFLQGLHSKECQQKDWCFSCQFESLVLKMNEGKSPISPTGIVSQLRKIGRQLGDGREEDAHEFLRCAIDKMQSDCLVNSGKDVSNLKEETTLIGLTFGGYLRSKIRCTRCNVKSERHERMMDLTVEIGGDIRTLEEALKQFTSTEILDGENKYQCTRCNSYEKAKKRLSVLEAPNVLTIALKRFQSGKFGKLNKSIRFSEILDLSSCVRGSSDSSAVYRLYGVIVHLDIMNAAFSGHYVCYVKNMHNKWFKVDDSTVKPVELDRVLTKGAYMLLYARCLPRPPRLLRDGVTSCDSKNQPIGYKTGGRSTAVRSGTTHSRNSYHRSLSSNDSIRAGSFYTEFPQMHRNRQEDSCSDASSLFSSNSDESSCSTVSTQDSPSYDELSDYIFGDSGSSWSGSPWSNASQQDTSLSPSPFLVRR